MARRKKDGLGSTSDVHRDRAARNSRTAEAAASNVKHSIASKQCQGALNDLLGAAYFAGRAEESEFSAGMSTRGGSSGKIYEETVVRARGKVVSACLRTRPASTKR